MPKQLSEIRDFRYGIVSSASETDIPAQAAAYSLNVDPTVEDGKLGGIPQDVTEIASFPATHMEWIEETGGNKERSLFYYNPAAGTFNYYKDYFGAQLGPYALPESVAPDGQLISPVQHGHALHVGMGNSQVPKWVGYVQHDQLGVAPTTNLVMYDAALGSYSLETNGIYKADYYSSLLRYIGMEYGGKQLLTINIADGAILKGSSDDGITFTSLQALCHSQTGDGYVWVYDNDGTTCGTLYEVRLNGATYSITKTVTIASWGGYGLEEPSSYMCTDLIQGTGTNKDVWFAFHNFGGGVKITAKRTSDPTEVSPPDSDLKCGYPTLVFKSEGTPADGSTITPANMTPMLNGTDAVTITTGRFYLEESVDESYHYINLMTLMKPFFNLDPSDADKGDNIGWFCHFKSGTASPKLWTSGNEWWRVGLCFYMIDRDMVAGSSAMPNSTSFLNFRSVKLNGDPTTSAGVTSFYDKSITSFQAILTKEAAPGTDYFIVMSIGKGSGSALYSFGDSALAFVADNFPNGNIQFLQDDSSHTYERDSMGINLPRVTISASYQGLLPIFVERGGYALASATLEDTGTLSDQASYGVAGNFIVSPRDTSSSADGMRSERTYRYFFAWEYDGYQVGPMSEVLCEHRPAEDGKAIFIDFYFTPSEIPNPRISGIIVLRSYFDGLISTQEDSLPRVIGRIDISKPTETKRLEGFSTDYYYYTVKDSNAPAETFEELAGYSHTATSCTPYYGLSCSGGGQLMVADCGGVNGINDTSNYAFFSEVGRYDQVDLDNEFVIFSEKPNAIAYHRGRFFAFAYAKFWRINPSGPMIEDEFDGIGCEGSDCVFANEYGLFVAGTTNIYIDNGNGFMAIGDPILTSGDGISGYQQRDTTDPPLVLFDMKRKAFLLFFTDGNANPRCYAFNVERNRWDLWAAPSGICDGLIGQNGEMLVTNAQALYSYLASSSKRTYSWWSKVFDAGMNTIDKKWYKVSIPFEGSANQALVSCKDNAGDSISVTDASVTGMIVKEMSDVRKRGLQVCVDGMNGTAVIDSIGMIYRPFVGVR